MPHEIGESSRLGNSISAWFSLCLVTTHRRRKELRYFKKDSSEVSICRALEVSKVANLTINEIDVVNGDAVFWWLYRYDLVKKAWGRFRRKLDRILNPYFFYHLTCAQRVSLTSADIVIHYRVGDFLHTLGSDRRISTQSVVEAVGEVLEAIVYRGEKPVIHILNSGQSHLCPSRVKREGIRILNGIGSALEVRYEAKVIHTGNRPVDHDFYTMINASGLVTGGGSLAMAAAIMSTGEVRTPACRTLHYIYRDLEPSQKISKRWSTYEYTLT